jgi:membrane protease YdiL (CAAX protease family)
LLPDDTAVGLLLFMLFQVVISQAYQTVYTFGVTSTYISYVFNFLLDAGFVLAVLLVVKEKKDARFFNEIKANRKFGFLDVLICLGISLCCIFGFSAITNCFLQFLYNLGYSSVVSDVIIENFGVYLFYVFFMCVLPAVSEETLFRGLIFKGLKQYGKTISILLTSLMFTIYHMSLQQTIYPILFGTLLTFVMFKENNIFYSCLMHFTNNFIALTFMFLKINLFICKVWYYILAIILFAIFVILLIYFIKKQKNDENIEKINKNNKILLISVLVIMFILWIISNIYR